MDAKWITKAERELIRCDYLIVFTCFCYHSYLFFIVINLK